MRTIIIALSAAVFCTAPSIAQNAPSAAKTDATIKSAFPTAPPDWQSRLVPDATLRECSASRNNPPAAIAEAIKKRELATIIYPADGNLLGDWKVAERLAQSGYGLRFSDYPPRNPNGGNCYACHQLTKREVSFGTLGPSLFEYGKLREYKPEAIKLAYEKIYNSHAAFPCSNMPRFGTNKILTIDQIKHLVALLMSKDSPVNTGK